jgi:membrane protease YdiL (CAAX protease family)
LRKEIIPSIILGLITPVLVYYGITFAVTALGIVTVSLAGSASLHDMNNISRILARYTMTFQVIAAGISIIPLAFMMRRDRPKRRFYYEKKKHGLWYAAAAAMAAAASIGGNFLINLTSLTESSEAFQEAESSLFSGSVAVQIIGIGFVVPICEEMVYRGLIYQRMRQFMSVTLSVVMSAVFFGVMHGNIVQGIYAFALGLMLAYAYEKYGSLRAPVLCHISANCVSLLLMYGGVSVESRTAAMITGFAGVAAALAMIVLIDRHVQTKLIYPDDKQKKDKEA